MDVYLNKVSLAALCGVHKNRFQPPTPDVIIGRYRGWKRSRVHQGEVSARDEPHEVLLSLTAVADRLRLTVDRISDLRATAGSGFPQPQARIAATPTRRRPATGGWDGQVYGWQSESVDQFAARTGRGGGATTGRRGRPKGSGNYAELPRCGRPLTKSVNGNGQPCQAVCRKMGDAWAPACGIHLTGKERAAVDAWHAQNATPGRRGRRTAASDHAAPPRCGRPTRPVNGRGGPCQAMCRKVGDAWAPACGLHLTGKERHTLGLTSPAAQPSTDE